MFLLDMPAVEPTAPTFAEALHSLHRIRFEIADFEELGRNRRVQLPQRDLAHWGTLLEEPPEEEEMPHTSSRNFRDSSSCAL